MFHSDDFEDNCGERGIDRFVRGHEWLVRTAVFKYIPTPALTARQYKMGEDDLFQVARIAMWEAARDFDPGRTDMELYSFLFWKIKCRLYNELQKQRYSNRAADLEAASMSSPLGESGELADVIPRQDYNVERIVVRKLLLEEAMRRLSDREKQLFFLKLNGFSYEEIAAILGLKSVGKLPDQLEHAVKKIDPGFTIRNKIQRGARPDIFVRLFNQGLSIKEICSEMDIHHKTYSYYKSTLKQRLAVI